LAWHDTGVVTSKRFLNEGEKLGGSTKLPGEFFGAHLISIISLLGFGMQRVGPKEKARETLLRIDTSLDAAEFPHGVTGDKTRATEDFADANRAPILQPRLANQVCRCRRRQKTARPTTSRCDAPHRKRGDRKRGARIEIPGINS
jgi:hypothetical protein